MFTERELSELDNDFDNVSGQEGEDTLLLELGDGPEPEQE